MDAIRSPEPVPSRIPSILTGLFLCVTVGICSGSASALFLWSLDKVTALRFAHPWLVWGMPLAGVLMVAIYRKAGGASGGGTAIVLADIRNDTVQVPKRMAPMILGSTLVSHLFGASVGREGTAVQMGAGLARSVLALFRITEKHNRLALTAGVASGFGAVFGTPLAGAVFALEAPERGKFQGGFWRACVSLVAAGIGDFTCRLWGASHIRYPAVFQFPSWPASRLDLLLWGKILAASLLFGMAGALFIRLSEWVRSLCKQPRTPWWAPPLLGGCLLAVLGSLPMFRDYLGLGASSVFPDAVTLQSAFGENGAQPWSWLCKLVFTALALGTGFKGGEVTPLFFIGATLGNAAAPALGIPVDQTAALGFVAVFAGASHTPLAGVFLGAELFGIESVPLFALACTISHLVCARHHLYGCPPVLRGEPSDAPTPAPAPAHERISP